MHLLVSARQNTVYSQKEPFFSGVDTKIIAMERGRDSDMRRNIPTAPLLAPQPKVKMPLASREQQASPKKKFMFYVGIYKYI